MTTITVEGRGLEELQKINQMLINKQEAYVHHAIPKPINGKVWKGTRGKSNKPKVIRDPAEIFFLVLSDFGQRYVDLFVNAHHFKQLKIWRWWVKNQDRSQLGSVVTQTLS